MVCIPITGTLVAMGFCLSAAGMNERAAVLIVVGAPGAPEYRMQFDRWAGQWQAAASKAGAESIMIGRADQAGIADRDRLRSVLVEKIGSESRTALDRLDRARNV